MCTVTYTTYITTVWQLWLMSEVYISYAMVICNLICSAFNTVVCVDSVNDVAEMLLSKYEVKEKI